MSHSRYASSGRFGMFSNEFTPFFEVQYLLKLYGLRKMGVKSSKRFPNIVEEAHREWLPIVPVAPLLPFLLK